LAVTYPTDPPYQITSLGLRLWNTRALPRIPQAKADIIVARLEARIAEINGDDQYVYVVDEVRVFGSYLGSEPELGDVDIAFRLEARSCYVDNLGEAIMHRAKLSGRRFNSCAEEVAYPQQEIQRLLKRVSRYVALHTIEELNKIEEATGCLVMSRVLFRQNPAV
jgi:hypothetical protein